MTELVYYADAYLDTLTTTVTKVYEEGVVFAATIFFGRSCGVKPDQGRILVNDQVLPCLGVKRSHGDLVHIVDAPSSDFPEVGETVILEIDWQRRFAQMKMHTVLHILSAIVWQDFNTFVTGSDITPTKGKLDFDFDRNLTPEELKAIEERANSIIKEGHETSATTISLEEAVNTPGLIRTKDNILPKGLQEVRIVNIGSVDVQTDGGIHVQRTDEIEPITITKHRNKGKGRRRIEVAFQHE